MVARNSSRGGLVPAVAYLRMSDKKQDKSIPAQQAEIEKYAAAHGFEILRWYRDEGISGAEAQKRLGFQQLILDAQKLRGFEAILVWDQDRFSRFDPMEANYYWFILRQAGVRIVTVGQGELDFSDLGGWLTASVNQHGKAQYLRDLSRNVLRGRLAKARRGKWQHNRAPYGYKIKGDGDLVVGNDTAEIVRRIFRLYSEADNSLWDIANILNTEGIPSPSGNRWKASSVQCILRRDTYVTGKAKQLRTPKGKFHSVIDGDIVVTGTRQRDRGEGTTVDCPPLVSAQVWRRTQQNLKTRTKNTTPGRGDKGSVLIGLMRCANCGGKMYAGDRARGKHTCPADRVYWCSTYHHNGQHACTRNLVHEQAILDFLVPRLQEMLLSSSNRKRLADALKKQFKARQEQIPDGAAQKRRLVELDVEIVAAGRELKRVPDDLYDLAVADLRSLRKERSALQAQIADLDAQNRERGQEDVDAAVDAALERSTRLEAVLRASDRKALRYALGELVERIDLWFEPIRGQKIVRSALTRGVVRLKQVSQLRFRDSPPGSRRS
jgi:site-specific DNA recombinase